MITSARAARPGLGRPRPASPG